VPPFDTISSLPTRYPARQLLLAVVCPPRSARGSPVEMGEREEGKRGSTHLVRGRETQLLACCRVVLPLLDVDHDGARGNVGAGAVSQLQLGLSRVFESVRECTKRAEGHTNGSIASSVCSYDSALETLRPVPYSHTARRALIASSPSPSSTTSYHGVPHQPHASLQTTRSRSAQLDPRIPHRVSALGRGVDDCTLHGVLDVGTLCQEGTQL
jgi:hypothetical protein